MRILVKKQQKIFRLFVMTMLALGFFCSNGIVAQPSNIETIVFGLYGDLNTKKESSRIEVTDQLKNMLKNGKIKERSISKLFKFDPAKKKEKGLFALYISNGLMFCSIQDGKDKLSLPHKNDIRILRGKSGSSDLQILKAFYGDLNQPKGKKIFVDVTGRIRGLVSNNAIQLSGENRSYNNLFGDPAKGIRKGLLVAYRVNDKMYVKILEEDEKEVISSTDLKNAYHVYTFGLRASVQTPVALQSSIVTRQQLSGAALDKFPQGTKVVLMSYADEDRPRLLRVGKDGHLVPKGLDPEDVSTHFIVHRDGDWVTLKSEATGDVIQVLPRLHMIRLAKEGAKDWAQWSAEFEDPSNPYGFVYLKNRASGGYLSAPTGKWTLGRMWTTIKERVGQVLDKDKVAEPAPQNKTARLKIFIADDLIKQMSKKKTIPEKVVEKVVDVVRDLEPLHAISGGKEFTYSPVIHRMKTKYHANWRFDTPGSGYVIFDARAANRMVVTFSSVPRDLEGGMYYVSIGHENNTRSGIAKDTSGKMLVEKDITKGASKDVVITGGLPEDGSRFDSYWIKVDQGTVTFGKGRKVGENEQMRFADPNPLKLVSYVGFGGGKLHRVHYKNIEVSGAAVTAMPAKPSRVMVLPAEFNAEGVKAHDIAAGLHNGQLELFAIINDELHYRSRGSMQTNPWIKITTPEFAKVRRVAIGSRDGALYVVTKDGKVFKYNWQTAAGAAVAPVTPVAQPVHKARKKKAQKKKVAKKAKRSTKKKGPKKPAHKKTTKKTSRRKASKKKGAHKKGAQKKKATT